MSAVVNAVLPRGNSVAHLVTADIVTPFARFRARDPLRECKVLDSMARAGQRHPLLVALLGPHQALLDGHKRLRAAIALRLETLLARLVEVDHVTALVLIATAHDARPLSAVEEGMLLRELHDQNKLTVREIARRLERNESFVQRRIALVRDFSEEILDLVRQGRLRPSVVRALFPIAHQDRDAAERIALGCAHARLASREAATVARAYLKARSERERRLLLDAPRRFLLRLAALPAPDPRLSPDEAALQSRLERLAGAACAIVAALRSPRLHPLSVDARAILQAAWRDAARSISDLTETASEVLS
jgi:ParB-like chromosome segregation protein Spo0J